MKVKLSKSQENLYLHDQLFRESLRCLERADYQPKDVVDVLEQICDTNCTLCNVTCSTAQTLNSTSPIEIRLFNNDTSEASYSKLTYLQVIEIQKILSK